MQLLSPADLSVFIGRIYDCSLDPTLWPATLKRVTEIFNTQNAVLIAHEPLSKNAIFFYQWGDDPARLVAYSEKYAAINPLLTAGWHTEINEPIRLKSLMEPEEFRQTRFFKEFVGPLGWCDMVGATLQKSAQRYTALSATRGREAGLVSDEELELMRILAPHFRRAITIHDALDAQGRKVSNLRKALDLAPSAIFLLNLQGCCLEANRAAERFLSEERLASLRAGQLLFADADVQKMIAAALAATAAGASVAAPTAGLSSAQSGRRYAIEFLPLTSAVRQPAGDAAFGLFLQEVGNLQPLPGEVLVKLYGLTPAETRLLVLLAQSMSLDEAAETLGIGKGTARTHLRQIFAKTGVNRQAEVVRLVMSCLPRPTA